MSRPLALNRAIFVVAALAIVVGIGLRFAWLDRPLFWQDEAYTALRTTGHTDAAWRAQFDGRTHDVKQILSFVSLDPARGPLDVAWALAREDPHHAPLFYVLDREWIGFAGTTPAGFRGLSAVLGTLGIGLAFALAASVLRSTLGGALVAALVALSPIFMLYSRQAREYALFADVTLLATLALVWALRAERPSAWLGYGLCVALGFYSDPLFALVALAHVIAVALQPRPLIALAGWALAALGGAALFVPWGLNALHSTDNIAEQMSWAQTAWPWSYLASKWGFNIGALAFDGEFRSLALAPVAILVAAGLAVAIVVFLRGADRFAVRIIGPLGLPTLVLFLVRDAVNGSHYQTVARYQTPLWLACTLVAGSAVLVGLRSERFRAVALGAWSLALCAGLASALLRGDAENWWDNNDQIAFQSVARTVDAAPKALVITQAHWHVPLVLARYLQPDAQLLLFRDVPPPIPPGRNAFVVTPTGDVLREIGDRTRGEYALANVSPHNRTIIAAFHRGLHREDPALERGDVPALVPDNALWGLRPLRRSHEAAALSVLSARH